MVEFGERLRNLRKQKNLTQKQLAAMIGVKRCSLRFSAVKNFYSSISPSNKVRVSAQCAVQIPSFYLMGMSRKKNSSPRKTSMRIVSPRSWQRRA